MHLLPRPRSIVMKEDSYFLNPETHLVLAPEARGELLSAQLLQEEIQRFAGLRLNIVCGLPQEGDILLSVGEGLAESYRLEIAGDGIVIAGGDAAGLLYGVQTLRQLIRQHGAGLSCRESYFR